MTNTISLTSVGLGPEHRGQTIWLPQLILEAARAGQAAIRDRTFVNCTIEGPAVILPVEGCDFNGCYMGDASEDPNALMLKPMGATRVTGAIAFHDCTFQACNFRGVGFTGDEVFLRNLAASLAEASR